MCGSRKRGEKMSKYGREGKKGKILWAPLRGGRQWAGGERNTTIFENKGDDLYSLK